MFIKNITLLICLYISGCSLGLSTYYAKGYDQTEDKADVMGEVKLSKVLYKNNNGKLISNISHESALLDQTDNRKGLNKIGITLQIGTE